MTRQRPVNWRAAVAALTHPDPRTSLWAQALNLPTPPTETERIPTPPWSKSTGA